MSKARPTRRAPNRKPAITETKLRRIIRDELARQHLVREGIMDSLKSPFKKLGEKAKKKIAEKAEEVIGKLKGAMNSVKGIGEYEKFFSALAAEKGGMSFDELVSSISDYSDLKSEADEVKEIDLASEMSAKQTATESISYDQMKTSFILIDENYLQRQEAFGRSLLSESVVLTLAGAWWATVKTVVGVCGLLGWSTSTAASICKYMGLPSVEKMFKKIHHFVEHVEDLFLDKVAFPKPVQYAAYRAMWAAKGAASKVRGKGDQGAALDYKAFSSEEGKEEREATIKALHAAVIMVLVFQAVGHIVESVMEFFHSTSKAAGEIFHAAGHASEKVSHAGVEVSNLAKTSRAAAAAAGELTGAKSIRA
jgi:hypothetical protein